MPILKRRRKAGFAKAHPLLRLHLRRLASSGQLSDGDSEKVLAALDNPEVLEAAWNSLGDDAPDDPDDAPPRQRDWAGFFDAIGRLLTVLIPLIIQLMEKIIPLFAAPAEASAVVSADGAWDQASFDSVAGDGELRSFAFPPQLLAVVEQVSKAAAQAAIAALLPYLGEWLKPKSS